MSAPPPTLEVRPNLLPDVLRQGCTYVAWRWEQRDGKWTKPPICPHNGLRASSTDPSTWGTFDQAFSAYRERGLAGIGRVLQEGDGIVGVDLDACRRSDTGLIDEWALAVVRRLCSYTEVSPSGTGLRILCRGVLPPGGCRAGHIEMYARGRYLTLTGHRLDLAPIELFERSAELAALHTEVFGGRQPPTPPEGPQEAQNGHVRPDDDDRVIEAARTSSQRRGALSADAFAALWDGDLSRYGGDHSAADLALCRELRAWVGDDPAAIDRLVRRSALMRPKWDERRGATTYGERTIATALDRMPGSVHREEDEPPASVREELPPFPIEALPDPLQAIARAVAEDDLCPVDLVGIFGLAILAAAVGGMWMVEVRPGWMERAIVWTAAIAESGEGKSPALAAVLEPLSELKRERYRAHQEALGRYAQAGLRLAKGEPQLPKPHLERLIVSDVTFERLAALLSESPQGLLWAVDELRGLTASLDQYKRKGGSDRQRLLEAWSGQDLTIDRSGTNGEGRSIFAPRPTLCITGGIQPSVAGALGGDDGLPQRFLIGYPPARQRRWRRNATGIPIEVQDQWRQAVRRLVACRPRGIEVVAISSPARDIMDDACERYMAIVGNALITGLARKLPTHLSRVALTLHIWVAGRQAEEVPIGPRTMRHAVQICDYFLAHAYALPIHAPDLTASRQDQQLDEAVAHLETWLRRRPDRSASRREIQRAQIAGIRTPAGIDRLIGRYREIHPGCVTEVSGHGLSVVRVRLP